MWSWSISPGAFDWTIVAQHRGRGRCQPPVFPGLPLGNGRGTSKPRSTIKFHPTGERINPSPETSEPKSLCNIPGFCLIPQSFVKKLVGPACPPSQISAERVQPSADVGAGTVTAYFVDNGRLGVLVRLELYPDKDGPDFHFLGHELCLRSPRPKPITA